MRVRVISSMLPLVLSSGPIVVTVLWACVVALLIALLGLPRMGIRLLPGNALI